MKLKIMNVHTPVDGCGTVRGSFSVTDGYTLELNETMRVVRITHKRDPNWHNMVPMENVPQFKELEQEKKPARSKQNAE